MRSDQKSEKEVNQLTNEDDSAVILRDLQDKKNNKEVKDGKKASATTTPANNNDDNTLDKKNDSFSNNNNNPLGEGGKKADAKDKDKKKHKGYIYLPPNLKHPGSNDEFYPVEYDNVIYDCFSLRVIYIPLYD